MGGFEVLTLINEPTAAAMTYAARHPGDQQILVFDWGGGTLDVTILRSVGGIFMEQASKGLPTKGGLDFDSRLRKLVLETVSDRSSWTPADRHRFDLDIELAKIKLSDQEFTVIQLPGGDSRRITRAMFEDSVESLIEEARRPIEQCLRDIGAGPGAIDSVVMVGGTSKVPVVRRFVGELLDRDPEVGVDPMTAVGEGAAIAAAILTGRLETNDFFVSTEHALGTVAVNPETAKREFSELIPRNHKLPASKTDTYVPVHAEQESVAIKVIEGDPEVDVDHPENVVLKEWVIELPGAGTSETGAFDMTYEYAVDGILRVKVTDVATGRLMLEDDVSYGVTQDRRKLVDIADRARRAVDGGSTESASAVPSDPEAAKLLQRAHVKVIPFLDGEEADAIRAAAAELESAGPDELPAAKESVRNLLSPYSYLF